MSSFKLDISKFVKKAPESATLIISKVIWELFQHFVDRTPHDTGRAMGGWSLGVNERIFAPEGRLAESSEDLIGYKDALSAIKKDSVTFIVNNVEYIVPLEYGHSQQAPAGFVRITLREFQQYIKQAAATL